MITELFLLACGMYIGKYHPEYVLIPRIKQEYINALLAYLKTVQTPTPTPTTTNELKNA